MGYSRAMQFDASLFFPQWQGGPNQGTVAQGGKILFERLQKHLPLRTIETDFSESAPQHGIWHYNAIRNNLKNAVGLLKTLEPKTLFTLGGDCSIDVAGIDYLNGRYGRQFGLIWIDAHADINTPSTSPSQYFHGMPLRVLMGEGEPGITGLLANPLAVSQVCYGGIRSIDPGEQDYIDTHRIAVLTNEDINQGRYDAFTRWVKESGIRHLHIHFDLDALDPSGEISVTYHIPGGIRYEAMQRLLSFLHGLGMTVGFTLTEYAPQKQNNAEIEKILGLAGAILPLKEIMAA